MPIACCKWRNDPKLKDHESCLGTHGHLHTCEPLHEDATASALHYKTEAHVVLYSLKPMEA